MKRYGFLILGLLSLFLAMFAVVEACGVSILKDPVPGMERGASHGGGLLGLLGLLLLTADVVLPVPSSVIMVAHGALFGFWIGALLSLLGSTGAFVTGFALGRMGRGGVRRFVRPAEYARASRLLQRWGLLAIVATRPVPMLAEATAILAGASALPWPGAVAAAVAGVLPAALLYAAAGVSASRSANGLLAFAAVLLIAAVYWHHARSRTTAST
jgi:uncharacterized membrane protein YdjX (TVP38/TMEM64 family)